MATTFRTSDSKLAFTCRKAKRDEEVVTVSAEVNGRSKEITGHVLEVGLMPFPGQELIWEITIAEGPTGR